MQGFQAAPKQAVTFCSGDWIRYFCTLCPSPWSCAEKPSMPRFHVMSRAEVMLYGAVPNGSANSSCIGS